LQHFTAGPACAGSDTGFVRVAAGTTFPWHGHDGDEVTLVLAGSSRDYSGTILTAGDEFALNGGSAHEFTALGDQDYIYAVRVVGVRFDVPKPDKL
jgi:quercetin dioxygenase-like cupin family protein